MHLERTADRLVVKDNPFRFWAFYCTFVFGGCLLLAMALSSSVMTLQLGVSVLIGLGNILGGLLMLKREPASMVTIDRPSNELRVQRWGLAGRSLTRFPLHQVDRAIVETSEHTDGGTVFRPSLLLKEAPGAVPVSRFWYQSGQRSRQIAEEINGFVAGP